MLTMTGGVKCWGDNVWQQLGNASAVLWSLVPIDVIGVSGATGLDAGGYVHTCALLGTGGAMCWGWTYNGQLGNPNSAGDPNPVVSLSEATSISSGTGGSCAVLSNTQVKCWGWNVFGQLGDGTTTNRSTPVSVLAP